MYIVVSQSQAMGELTNKAQEAKIEIQGSADLQDELSLQGEVCCVFSAGLFIILSL